MKLILFLFLITSCSLSEYDSEMSLVRAKLENANRHDLPLFPSLSENDKTLSGIDSNQNGIRDDIELWIELSFENKEIKQTLRRINVVFQKLMKLQNGNQEEIKILLQEYSNSRSCLLRLEKRQNLSGKITLLQQNNIERRKKLESLEIEVAGEVGIPSMPKAEALKYFCKF